MKTDTKLSIEAKCKHYLELAKITQQSIDGRKSVEWKVAFGFWAAIGAATVFAVDHPKVVGQCFKCYWTIGCVALWLIWTFLWQYPIHRAFMVDKAWKHFYMDQSTNANKEPTTAKVPCQCNVLKDLWFWGQVLVTGVFLLLSWAMVQRIAVTCQP